MSSWYVKRDEADSTEEAVSDTPPGQDDSPRLRKPRPPTPPDPNLKPKSRPIPVPRVRTSITPSEPSHTSTEDGNLASSSSSQTQEKSPRIPRQQTVKNDHPKELNILILGETGVGKSTWINAFINAFNYSTLAKAEAGELFNLIPSKFTVFDENNQRILVSTGKERNEVLTTGQSATQEPRVYPFQLGTTRIRLIDTPGIGDVRGIAQDRENFRKIMSTLSYFTELHGICILLKPNEARLHIMFQFCVKQLLTHLHKEASKNILFCFTNSRATFYRPGETLPALEALLEEIEDSEIKINTETVFCFDSEAYRFLAAVKNTPPVRFSPDDRKNFEGSWDKLFTETGRMLDYIGGLQPHLIQSTLNLNHFRELVLKMSRPLAEINRNLQMNRAILDNEKNEIKNMREDIQELLQKKMGDRADIQLKKLDSPKMVCLHKKCIKLESDGFIKRVEYTTICHPDCTETGVPADTIGHVKLLKCSKISLLDACCKHCRHHYTHHHHIYYDSAQVATQVENEAVSESLEKKLSAKEMKQKMIEEKDQLILEFEEELGEIQMASVRFACFLKANAITPYNDGLMEYLNHLIQEEENKVAFGGESKTLQSLKQSKDSYLYEKMIMEGEIEEGREELPDKEEVNIWVRRLKGLKHSGRSLSEALEFMNHSGKMEFKEQVVRKLTAKIH